MIAGLAKDGSSFAGRCGSSTRPPNCSPQLDRQIAEADPPPTGLITGIHVLPSLQLEAQIFCSTESSLVHWPCFGDFVANNRQ